MIRFRLCFTALLLCALAGSVRASDLVTTYVDNTVCGYQQEGVYWWGQGPYPVGAGGVITEVSDPGTSTSTGQTVGVSQQVFGGYWLLPDHPYDVYYSGTANTTRSAALFDLRNSALEARVDEIKNIFYFFVVNLIALKLEFFIKTLIGEHYPLVLAKDDKK